MQTAVSIEMCQECSGFKCRQECTAHKLTNGLAMLKHSVHHGFMAKYVLADSWFGSLAFIKCKTANASTQKRRE